MAAGDMEGPEQASKSNGNNKKRRKRQSKKSKPTKPLKRCAESLSSVGVANDDILSEIFTRLPNARVALNCAAVCTLWHSVVYHPNFCADFKRRRIDSATAFTILFSALEYSNFNYHWLHGEFFSAHSAILHGKLALPSLRNSAKKPSYLSFLPLHSQVMSSWKDLLLVQLPPSHNLLCICNPLTRQQVPLPDPRGILDPSTGVVFHSDSRRRHGFVVCDESQDYECGLLKAYTVALVSCNYEGCFDVAVFRSETEKWDAHSMRRFALPLDREIFWEPQSSVVTSDGILYLPMMKNHRCVKVSAFDPRDVLGTYFEIGLPQGLLTRERRKIRFGVLKGKMRIWQACVEEGTQKFVLKVWQLNGKCGDWVSVIDVKLESTRSRYNSTNRLSDATTLIFDPNNDNAFFFVNPYSSYLQQYDIRTGRYRNIRDIGFEKGDSDSHNFTLEHPCWPSRIPLLTQTQDDIDGSES